MRNRLAHILASLALLLTVLATSVTGQALAQNGSSPPVDPTVDEPVSAAAFVVDEGGQTAGVYGWDSIETSGALCDIDGFTGLNYVRVHPIQVYAVEGHIGQRVTVDAMAGTVNGELLDADSWEGTTDPQTGSVWFPAEEGEFHLYAGYVDVVYVRLLVIWYDEVSGEEIGYLRLQLEYYDNSPISGALSEDACNYGNYAPTPTMIPGGYQPGDAIQTTGKANLRSGPGTTYSIIQQLPANHRGSIVGFPLFGNGYTWYPVAMDGDLVGYLASINLTRQSATATPTRTPTRTPTHTATPTRTATRTATTTSTPTITNTPTETLVPSVTNTPTNSATPSTTLTPSITPTQTNTPMATDTRTPTSTPTTIAGGFAPGDAVRTTKSVNLRSGPGTSFSILGTVPNGGAGTVTGYPTVAGGYTWYPVSMNGFSAGYIAGQYLTKTGVANTMTPTRTPTRPATTAPGTATFTSTPISGSWVPGDTVRTTKSVNLRSGPGTNFGVLGVVPSNTNGTVTGAPVAAGGYIWYPVAMTGFPNGYLASNYLTKTGSGPSVTPTRTPTRTPTIAGPTVTRTPTIPSGFQIGETVQVNTSSLNLRSGPGSSTTSLGVMPRGTRGTVTGAPQAVGSVLWYPVDMEGFGEGWVSGQYLTNVLSASSEPTIDATATSLPVETATEPAPEPTLEPTLEPTSEPPAIPTEVVTPPEEPAEIVPTEAPPPDIVPETAVVDEAPAGATP